MEGLPISEQPVTDLSVTIGLHTLVGELLALGKTNEEILLELQTVHSQTVEDAYSTLRSVYDSWSSIPEGLNIQPEDSRNWHIHLRMKLLQSAIMAGTTPSQRLALMILDSMAGIQGISTIPEQAIPLSIELVERKTEQPTKGEADGVD
ncbi:hypothetical protein LCGC14_0849510 [marine sediment metagenome]|uniref:Uncharacterized protein n=1 Tax=marine sediment metagenome TaxID=412755 RepID=A0A0F9SHS8_9ZZZZ